MPRLTTDVMEVLPRYCETPRAGRRLVVPEDAVVGDVALRHEEVAAADLRDEVVLRRPAADRHALAERVVVANDQELLSIQAFHLRVIMRIPLDDDFAIRLHFGLPW